ncbi:MAG: hypothetical protein HYY84_12855 [Deltaproteobacteria bacterium]|nr:hypothetical protein [Deltaproteobacteria bacterium]
MKRALSLVLVFLAACDSRGMGGGWSAGSQSAAEGTAVARKHEKAIVKAAIMAVGRLEGTPLVAGVESKRGRRAVVDRALQRTATLKAKDRERAIATLLAIPDDWPRAKERRQRLRGIIVAIAQSDFAKKRFDAFESRCKEAESIAGSKKVAWCALARKRLAERMDKARFNDALAVLKTGEGTVFVDVASRVEGKARVAALWAKALRFAKAIEETAPETAFAIARGYPPHLKDALRAKKLAERLRPLVKAAPAPTQLATVSPLSPAPDPVSATAPDPVSATAPAAAPAPATKPAKPVRANLLASPIAQTFVIAGFATISMGAALLVRRTRARRAAARLAEEEVFTVRSFALATNHARCLICGRAFDLNARPVNCARCGTPHHIECWQYNRVCAIYACDSRKAA